MTILLSASVVNEMAEKLDAATGRMEKIGETAAKFREEIANYLKDRTVEVKDWRFVVGKTEEGHIIEAELRLLVKPKK